MSDCEQKISDRGEAAHPCPAAATHRMFWPSKDMHGQLVCTHHLEKAYGIAKAMGFTLIAEKVASPASPHANVGAGGGDDEGYDDRGWLLLRTLVAALRAACDEADKAIAAWKEIRR